MVLVAAMLRCGADHRGLRSAFSRLKQLFVACALLRHTGSPAGGWLARFCPLTSTDPAA